VLSKSVHLALVGVDGDHAVALLQLCRHHWPHLTVTAAPCGDAALAALRNGNGHLQPRLPFLILLDLRRLPVAAGVAFLQALRQDSALRLWPVFVLGNSAQANDIRSLYDFGVAAYVPEANIDDQHQRLVEMLDAYLQVVEFPFV
jgi:CheY-like chemotaxis protein